MAKIYLDPKGFQNQIDSFRSGADNVKKIKYSLNNQGIRMRSVDRYLECAKELNKTIQLFGGLMDQDTESMKMIKAKWMNTDEKIALKTIGEILFGK